jgi:cytochrome c-type biogenesis protein CcmF
MPSLGSFLLLFAFVICAYAIAASVVGARRRSNRLIESGIGAFYLMTAVMTVASVVIIHAFVTGDYSIKYVQHYSDSVQPLFYKITSYWGGLDGSIMFWVFMLSIFGSVAIFRNRQRHRELIPYVVAIIAGVEMFFLFLTIIHNNPFSTYITETPTDGAGLNPLLQNFYMAIHPPTMYLGFVGLTIPYAFGMAATITGYLDDSWLRAVRRWTMLSWFCLSFGLTLGMIWAYEELGWGGFWGWDPVENAGSLPWFTATAFLHSVMVQERRGMLRVWNVSLVTLTFFLTIFGTFMTRTGVVQSVHAFGESTELMRLFSVFMVTILVFSFSWIIYRLPLLKARNELESWMSREAAFLANNWILVFAAFFILFATMFPTIAEAVNGERLTVGPPFFNKWMVPLGLVLLFLTGYGPLLAWRKTTLPSLRTQFIVPTVSALVVGGVVVAMGVRIWSSGLCFALSGFVFGTIAQEFWRGARVRQGNTGTDIFTALVGLVSKNKRRYGGYMVHVGITLMFLGFAGAGFQQEQTVLLKPGQSATLGAYTVTMDKLSVTDDGQKQMTTSHVTVTKDGQPFAKMYPARWAFRKHENEPTTEVAIHRGFAEDFYLVQAGTDAGSQTASIKIVINPLVNWIWFGFGVLAIGTGIALLPEQVFVLAGAKVPEGAATTGAILLAIMLGGQALSAQEPAAPAPGMNDHVSVPGAFVPSKNALEEELRHEMACVCGACGHEPLTKCTCGTADQMRTELRGEIDAGKSKQQIIDHFTEIYGGTHFLGAPVDKGFNRLAWLLPYVVGGVGLVTVTAVARKWTRPAAESPTAPAPVDASLNDRLDDELRDLD